MIFVAPWVLLALLGLPILWWLLRVTPPAPRSEDFPAIRFLLGLSATEETPARTPWWLMALRMTAASLVIVALARPVMDAGSALTGSGPVLLVIDNGWASAKDWARRKEAAAALLDRAERAGRKAALLVTAADGNGGSPSISAEMPVAELRARLAGLQPQPWPPDRAAAAAAIRAWGSKPGASVIYVPDGLTDGADFAGFAQALGNAGAVTEICCDTEPPPVLLPPTAEADRLVARLAQIPRVTPSDAVVLAQSGDGRTLARTTIAVPAGAANASGAIQLPPELRNRLTRLVLEGQPNAGSVVLLDERWRRRPVGLISGDLASAETPFAGSLYFLHRALGPYAELRTGDAATLLKRDLSVLILADRPLPDGPEREALTDWVRKGGLLIRFAGPRTAEEAGNDTDTLLPVRLLAGDRQLGGAMSWSQPAGLAPFPTASPFDGMPVPEEVRVTRQVLAEPTADLAPRTWASLADGTPLVTEEALGAGRVVLFHVTANADWSNLPLSGLFVDMLRRLIALSAGVATTEDSSMLAPAQTLDGFGLLTDPPPTATGLRGDAFGKTPASPAHPPGLYGPENGRRALNLGTVLPAPEAAPTISGATLETVQGAAKERALGPPLIALAILLLAADMLISLGLRGLLRARVAAGISA
ncbi:MAG: BatA domain-containing protein, partial [Rhodopila sp.]